MSLSMHEVNEKKWFSFVWSAHTYTHTHMHIQGENNDGWWEEWGKKLFPFHLSFQLDDDDVYLRRVKQFIWNYFSIFSYSLLRRATLTPAWKFPLWMQHKKSKENALGYSKNGKYSPANYKRS